MTKELTRKIVKHIENHTWDKIKEQCGEVFSYSQWTPNFQKFLNFGYPYMQEENYLIYDEFIMLASSVLEEE